MDLYHYNDPGQSQSSEMLNELIESEQKRVKTGLATQSSSKSNSSHSTESSNASFPPASNTAPVYNLHGLVATDDETPSYEAEEEEEDEVGGAQDMNEGSQKENIGASIPKNDNARVNQASVSKTPITSGRRSPVKSNNKDNANELYVVSNQGSSKKATTQTKPMPSTRYKPRPRPRSTSQDSFAQDPSEDRERNQLLRSEHFTLPLDELSKKTHFDHLEQPSGSHSTNMFSRQSPYHQNPQRTMGTILVESTPSQSSSERSQPKGRAPDPRQLSEQLEATQLVDTQPTEDAMNVDEDGYESSSPSSSYGALLDGGQELEPTQPSTQPDIPPESVILPSMAARTATSSGMRTIGPKSLLSSLVPQKQWRYAQFTPNAPVQQVQPAVPMAHAFEETQPSDDHYPIPAPPPAYVPITKSLQPESRKLDNSDTVNVSKQIPVQRASSPLVDSMDVVPDSEPSRIEEVVKQQLPEPRKVDTPNGKSPATRAEQVSQRQEEEQRGGHFTEEEDTPLAVRRKAPPPKAPKVAASSKAKGKEKAKDTLPVEPTQRNTRSTRARNQSNQKSYEYAVVPSSMPDQDFSSKSRPHKTVPKATPKPKKQRRAPPSTRERREEEEECSDAEEEEQEEQEEDPGTSKKRKRGANKLAPTAPAKRQKKLVPSTPANARPSRRTYLSQNTGLEPSRVFALSKDDGYYRIATIYTLISAATKYADTYLVKFDDGVSQETSVHNMRRAVLRARDEVIPDGYNRSFFVVENTEEPAHSVIVDVNGTRKTFQMSQVKMACASMRRRWEDRKITDELSLVFVVDPSKPSGAPTPLKPSQTTKREGSNDPPKPPALQQAGLIVTLTNRDGYTKAKNDIMQAVSQGGGQVIEDLNSIINMDGKLSNNNNRWIIRKNDVEWKGDDIERIYLVADEFNQKPKYLLALALGIPCLSLAWLWKTVDGPEAPWTSHLLAQGFSAYLGCRPSQQIDTEWGNSVEHVRDIMNNLVPAKVFRNKRILCIGNDMLPPPKAKRKLQDTGNAVPRIILAMGAEEVEAVAFKQHASKDLSTYDYIVVRDRKDHIDLNRGTIVEWSWVKECLIASRLVPHDGQAQVDEDYSQEA